MLQGKLGDAKVSKDFEGVFVERKWQASIEVVIEHIIFTTICFVVRSKTRKELPKQRDRFNDIVFPEKTAQMAELPIHINENK